MLGTFILWRSKELVEHAVPGIWYTDTRLQFAVTDTALVVLVEPQYRTGALLSTYRI